MSDDQGLFRLHYHRDLDVLVAEGDATPIRRDLELHLLSIGARHEPAIIDLLGDGLTAMGLYLVSRPRFDHFGWTIQLQEPLLNLFFAGSASDQSVVGRAFSSGVERLRKNPSTAYIPLSYRRGSGTQIKKHSEKEIYFGKKKKKKVGCQGQQRVSLASRGLLEEDG